jgi:hypothetical protein
MWPFIGCEQTVLAEVRRLGLDVLVVGPLLAPLIFIAPPRARLRLLAVLAFFACLPGILQVLLALGTDGSLCENVLPRCRKAGPCWASNSMLLVVVGIPLGVATGVGWLCTLLLAKSEQRKQLSDRADR